MDFAQVKELIQMLETSSLRELHVTLGGDSVYLSRNAEGFATVEQPMTSTSVNEDAMPGDGTMKASCPTPQISQDAEGEAVLSPLVGTYFASPAPDKPPFVHVGDAVKAGQVLCIVEAMKVMNEITAEKDGVVTALLVENERLVEYNQPLMRIL